MKLFSRSRAAERGEDTVRIFYCGDIHGSDVCFRKFLNAGAYYDANVLILGGDITGKALVPIVRHPDGSVTARLFGEVRRCRSEREVGALRTAISTLGFYPYDVTEDGLEALESDRGAVDDAFREQMIRQISDWVALADERLDGTDRECLLMPGNDDEYYIDEALASGSRAQSVDGKIVRLANGLEVVSLAWSNPTPWASAREFSEEEIAAKLHDLVAALEDPASAVLNVHVPPYASGLDTVQKLTDDFRPVFENGVAVEIPCGSTAVRDVIVESQPLLALHGHVHESKGATHIGRTLCINPGSDYASGRLHGVLVDVAPAGVEQYLMTTG